MGEALVGQAVLWGTLGILFIVLAGLLYYVFVIFRVK